ncbi:MAG: cytidylate kinase-like family protein [Tepidisphaeraceae bacterium]|jgi:cytidylate kinase
MPISIEGVFSSRSKPILAAIRSIGVAGAPLVDRGPATAVLPFVTISRQAGAGGLTVAHKLVEQLNRRDPGEQPWTAWDRELVQKVAEEHHIDQSLVDALEDRGPTWLEELLGGMRISETPETASEFRVYWKTAATIRAIAQVGRCVIVGRGGVFVTANMPRGIHIRLVAPLDFRIRNYAAIFNMPVVDSEARVKELDANRAAFYRRHWPRRPLTPEAFTATFNTASVGEREVVEAVAAMIPGER